MCMAEQHAEDGPFNFSFSFHPAASFFGNPAFEGSDVKNSVDPACVWPSLSIKSLYSVIHLAQMLSVPLIPRKTQSSRSM